MGISAAAMVVAGGAMQATSQYEAGKARSKQAKYAARVADAQADDARRRGYAEETRYRQRVDQIIGAQRASFAAQGVDVSEGSAADVQADTARIGEIDALTIRNNAIREAFGYKTQAVDARNRARIAKSEGTSQAVGTLLNTAVSAYTGYSGGVSRAPSSSSAQYNYYGDESGVQFSSTGEAVRARR